MRVVAAWFAGNGARIAGAVLVPLALSLALPAGAGAALTQRGDLFVSFKGGIAPKALPRQHQAPIGVSLAGTVKTLSGQRPPALRMIRIELNRGGRINTKGLPVCPRWRIEVSSSAQALAACGGALVGRGTFVARTAFPEQDISPADGEILAFNARVNGRSAILAHVYGTQPAPGTRIVVFHIRRPRNSTFGTVLTGHLPPSLNRWGYLRHISLHLRRDFTYRSQRRSYITAACKAPPGFPVASFYFARATMAFEDGRTLRSAISRTCHVRR